MMSLYLGIGPNWGLFCFVVLCLFSSSDSYFQRGVGFVPRDSFGNAQISYKYDRLEEVYKECKPILATASDLKSDDNVIRSELSFINGDWEQPPGKAPLLPLNDTMAAFRGGNQYSRYGPMNNVTSPYTPVKLVSFWITDVSRKHGTRKSVAVNGYLSIGITSDLDGSFDQGPYGAYPEFHMWDGHSKLSILFQGIYAESEENEEERVLCLLGNAMLPSRKLDPSESIPGDPGPFGQIPLLQDDQILLVLRYPRRPELLNMAIRGELKSLNSKDSLKHFDEVRIISQLSSSEGYNFIFDRTVSKACNSYPYNDSCMDAGTDVYKQTEFCSLLEQISKGDALTIVPNWKCNGTDGYCSRLGPFVADKEINDTDGSFRGVGLVIQNLRCEQSISNDGVTSSAKVFSIFRAVSPLQNVYNAASRSGLSNMTVSAEGTWNSLSGKLCMIACLGIVTSEMACDSRVCLYIPLSFSIKQRSALVGSFSSLNSSARPYFPLSFDKIFNRNELWQFQNTNLQYKYSKIAEAGSILEKDQPFSFGNVIKKSVMKFPKLRDSMSYMESISLLSEDLTFHVSNMPDPTPSSQLERIDLVMDIFSIGPMLGSAQEYQNVSNADEEVPYRTKAEYTERELLLNVSAQITIFGKRYSNLSAIFLEGIYDPSVGKMYLIGCRDVRASWKILFESMDLEAGLDCQIEVVVSYPPTTARWFVNPTAKISVSSKRNEDDPLYFHEVKLQTLPLTYRMQREDILSRRGFEGILRILTLSMAITFILSQLIYIRESGDCVPFISIMMLGVQILGYSLPLVTGAEAVFGKMASKSSYGSPSFDLEKNSWLRIIDYCVKLLVLTCFLLTLRLWQKVWKSRIRLLSRAPLEPHRVPSDRRVLIITFIIHLVGYATILITHSSSTNLVPGETERYYVLSKNSNKMPKWEAQLEEYVGLVHDFFLLPQVIGNLLWQTQNVPLRKLYYIGITAVRLLPHVYDYTRDPIPSPYFPQENEFVNPAQDFYSKFGDIAIPTTAVILALIVYIQQKWSYEKISQTLTIGPFRLLPSASRAYQQLPSKISEAELVSSNGNDQDRHDTLE